MRAQRLVDEDDDNDEEEEDEEEAWQRCFWSL